MTKLRLILKLKQRIVVHIISDNKLYRDDVIDLTELISMIYGKVVWKSNSFKDIDFRSRVPFVVIFLVVLIFGLVTVDPPRVFLLTGLTYLFSGPIIQLKSWLK